MADYVCHVERLRFVYGHTRKGNDGVVYVCEPPFLNYGPELVKHELLQIHDEAPAAIAYHREFNAEGGIFDDDDDNEDEGNEDRFIGNQFYSENEDRGDANRFIGNQFYGDDSDGDDSDDENAFFFPADCEYVPGAPSPLKEPVEQGGVFKNSIGYDTGTDSDSDASSVSSDSTEDSDCPVFSDDEDIEVKGTSITTTVVDTQREIIHSPTDSTTAIAIIVTPPSPSAAHFALIPAPDAACLVPFNVVAMPLSMDPAIKMIDSDLLNDIASANLRAPEITSIIVFSPNGTVITHASSTYHLRDLRRLASTCGQTYLAHQESAADARPNPVVATQIDSTPTTSQGSGEVANMFLEFDTNTALVSRISEDALLAVVGPRELAHDSSLTNGEHNHNHIDTSSAKSEDDSEEHPRHDNDTANNDDTSSHSSKRSAHQRRSSQDLAPNSSALVLEALEQKSEALTKYLKEIMAEE